VAFIDVQSPITERALDSIHGDLSHVQFVSALTDSDYQLLADRMRSFPDVTLRAYGSYDGTITDVDFLRHFPFLRSFQADALYNSLGNIDGLANLPDDVGFIGLGQTRKRLSLAPLARFTGMTRLYLEGHTKDIEVVTELTQLHSVTLRSITLSDLSLLTPLAKLRALALRLGGTRNLSLLPKLQNLDYLELWMVKGLSDLSPIAGLPNLEYLFLQSLRQVTELPELSGLARLRRLWIETMKGLNDLSPIREAPALRQLAIVDMPHLQPHAFAPLVGHPSLTSLRAGLGSKRKNDAVHDLIDLPREGDWHKPLNA
jgi:internalin A